VFAGFLAAEQQGLSPGRDGFSGALEAATLRQFYDFAAGRAGATWLHWNMNEARFGFAALAQRYRVVTGVVPPECVPSFQFDLAEYLKRRFGDSYVPHPRLHRLIELNDLAGSHYLDVAGAGRCWAAGNFAAVADALSARVTAICEIYRLLRQGRLKIGGGRIVALDTPALLTPEHRDGDMNEKGRIYLAGGWRAFGPQQRALLQLVLRPDGVSTEEAIRLLNLTDGRHLSKLLTVLRKSLRKCLKKSDSSLVVDRVDGHLSAHWVPKTVGQTT
jgi:hypothetical protein